MTSVCRVGGYINMVEMSASMITVSEDVVRLIESKGQDYRVCTACSGPALVPITVKGPKESDIKIPVGNNTLYVSRVQAQYISEVTMDMLYDKEDIDS